MYLHANAKLGLAGRLALVRTIEGGCSVRAAAAAFSVSPATAHRWWRRWLDGGRQAAALVDRSSRPHHSPRLLAAELQERICDCRRKTGWGPRLVAGATGFAHSTVWKVLKRAGLSRRSAAVKEPAHSYEWPCPGDLLHMDTSRYAGFSKGTTPATQGPSRTGRARTARWSASTRRWHASGRTVSPTAHIDTATPRCHTGSTTTTSDGRTAHSETGPRSAAFTTSVGRTASSAARRGSQFAVVSRAAPPHKPHGYEDHREGDRERGNADEPGV